MKAQTFTVTNAARHCSKVKQASPLIGLGSPSLFKAEPDFMLTRAAACQNLRHDNWAFADCLLSILKCSSTVSSLSLRDPCRHGSKELLFVKVSRTPDKQQLWRFVRVWLAKNVDPLGQFNLPQVSSASIFIKSIPTNPETPSSQRSNIDTPECSCGTKLRPTWQGCSTKLSKRSIPFTKKHETAWECLR